MVEVRYRLGDPVHQPRHIPQLLVIDVLRLVGQLVVVLVAAGAEEDDRDTVTRVHPVIAAAIVVLGMAVGVVLVVEHEAVTARGVHLFDQVAQLGGQTS